MSLIGDLTAKLGLRERRAGVRVPTRGLEAFYSKGGEQKPAAIKDIGLSGICLAAGDLLLGSKVEVTLRRKAIEDAECGTRVCLPAKVVRVSKRDIGLQFIPEHIDPAEWSKLVLRAAQLSPRNDGVRLFRVAKALAFLQRISPSAEAQFLAAITGGMSHDGEERALEILLLAEDRLLSQGQTSRRRVSEELVRRIVDRGVNIDTFEAEMAHFWAGLLATSTLEGTDDEESAKFAELLSKVDPIAVRILISVCEKAMRVGWDTGFVLRKRLEYSLDEVKKISEAKTIRAMDVGINTLFQLGLLRSANEMPTFQPAEVIDLTPTGLGLRLYARCTGHLEVSDARAAGGNAS